MGCGSTAARMPAGAAPDPETVTQEEPGGNAHDPHRAALLRTLEEPWGLRRDRDDQVDAPLPDAPHWRRVRFHGVEHFLGFRYGDEHHVMTIAFVHDVPSDVPAGTPHDSLHCLRRFEMWARPRVRAYEVQLERIGTEHGSWEGEPLVIRTVNGSAMHLFSRREFSAAWAAYPAYDDACLVYGVVAQWQGAPELARQVRDRFIFEGFSQMVTLTDKKAWRREK